MNTAEKWHGTTIILLRKNNVTVVAGDGQVRQKKLEKLKVEE